MRRPLIDGDRLQSCDLFINITFRRLSAEAATVRESGKTLARTHARMHILESSPLLTSYFNHNSPERGPVLPEERPVKPNNIKITPRNERDFFLLLLCPNLTFSLHFVLCLFPPVLSMAALWF